MMIIPFSVPFLGTSWSTWSCWPPWANGAKRISGQKRPLRTACEYLILFCLFKMF